MLCSNLLYHTPFLKAKATVMVRVMVGYIYLQSYNGCEYYYKTVTSRGLRLLPGVILYGLQTCCVVMTMVVVGYTCN